MINQDQIPQFQSLDNQANYFIDTLLLEGSSDKEMFNSGCQEDQRQQLEAQQINFLECKHQNFALNLLNRQQSNNLLPQNPFQDVGEDDPLVLNPSQKKLPITPTLTPRKDSKIDKIAYFEETRAIKIQRYKLKKCRRMWDRKIFYDCRKVVADNRERINGRFVKKSPLVRGYDSAHKASLVTGDFQILKEFSSQGKSFQDLCL